jgi:hypothetical protein
MPYVDPYYQTYVTPQLEKVQPFWDPVSTFTQEKYETYGAHRVQQAQHVLEKQWDQTVRPQLQKVQDRANAEYKIHLAPHVDKVSTAVTPHYEQLKDSSLEIYHLTLLPTYEAVLPYAHKAYVHGNYVVSHVVFPYACSAKNVAWTFITRTVWPHVRVLYGDNVEPQLVRIRERLGRHRDQQKIESAVEAVGSAESSASAKARSDATHTSQTSQTSTASIASETPSGTGWDIMNEVWPSDSLSSATEKVKSRISTEAPEPQLTGAELREKLNNDLRQWQSKFAVAADKGAEDLEQRVTEITDRQVKSGVKGHGTAMLVQLEEAADSAVAKFKKTIKKTVEGLPEDATEDDLESAYENCAAKTRDLGHSVKEKAQAIRSWKANYDQETDSLVQAAVKSTVEVLERIHGLGLQEVGMRWAWMDGVTYKDWQNYHKLRNTLSEWQAEVEAVGSRHEGLKVAHDEAKALEDKAMNVASHMVDELLRLKDVAKWKIWAGDSTDDFSNKKVPARVFKASTSVVSNIEEAASKVSNSIIGSETPMAESAASAIKEKASVASSQASALADSVTSSGASAASAATEKAAEAASSASQAASEAAESVRSFASPAPKKQKVMGGVMAQVMVQAREIVFDDEVDEDETYSHKLQDMIYEAGGRAAELSKAVSQAILRPTQTQGSMESVSSLASEQYEAAIAAASKALYGTEQHPIESMTSVAADKFAAAVTAASYAVYGTPTPTAVFQTVHVQASSKYDQAISLANEQYANAKSQLSVLVSGTPKPAHETMLSIIEKAYSDSLAAASDRLQLAMQYTDTVKSYAAGPTQGYFESVSSIASFKLAEGLSAASAQFTAQPTPAVEGARRQYYEAVGLAHARYQEFLDSASTAVYGPKQGTVQSVVSGLSESAQAAASKVSEAAESLASQASSSVVGSETPWTESVASQASQNWEVLIAKASSQVYGTPAPWTASLYSQAGAYGAQATAQAVAQYAAIQGLVSELVVGKEPDFTESVMSRLSTAYYMGIPAAMSSASSFASANFEAASSIAGESYDHATSMAGEAYESATSVAGEAYDSASSVVSSIFTPPPAVEAALSQANEQINLAVESASVALYGTPKGNVEQATENIASAYSSVQSKASEAIYGTQQVQDRFAAVTASAQAAISEAIYGPPTATGFVASATDGAGSVIESVTSIAGEKAADAAAAASSAIYGPEQGAVESASSRLAAAVEAANSRISEMYANAASTAGEAASSVSSVVTEATQGLKDEL